MAAANWACSFSLGEQNAMHIVELGAWYIFLIALLSAHYAGQTRSNDSTVSTFVSTKVQLET